MTRTAKDDINLTCGLQIHASAQQRSPSLSLFLYLLHNALSAPAFKLCRYWVDDYIISQLGEKVREAVASFLIF